MDRLRDIDRFDCSAVDAQFDQLVCEVVAKLEQGDPIDLAAITAECPEQSDRLAELLPALEAVATLNDSDPILPTPAVKSESFNFAQTGVLGDFRIIREIGRGGMGIVYEAEQLSLSRRVALKVLPFAAMLGEQQLQRFKNEARAAGTLKHPHIVSVYSVGCDRGLHYYAMELVEGQSLDKVLSHLRSSNGELQDRGAASFASQSAIHVLQSKIHPSQSVTDTVPLTALSTNGSTESPDYFQSVARLGVEAADALHHAHLQGIIHRDIKPANLLLDESGKLWIADFGLARIETDAGLTVAGDMLGTLRYMSPEQALSEGVVDQRTDIYSLGATLYELATLQPAYGATDRTKLLQQITLEPPRPPRQINRRIPPDLDTIICKAIEKDAADRYRTAKDLSDDLRRYLLRLPIAAKPASYGDRLVKWSRRYHKLVGIAALVIVLFTAVLAVATVLIARSHTQMEAAFNEAAHHQDRLADLLYAADMRLAAQAWKDNDPQRALEILDQHIPPAGEDRRDIEWYFLRSRCTAPHVRLASVEAPVYDFTFSADATRLATVGKDATLRVYDWPSMQRARQIDTGQTEVNGIAFSPDGQTIATSGDDGAVKLWHGMREPALRTINAHDGLAYDVVYAPGTDCLISSGEDSVIRLWNPQTGELIGSLTGHEQAVTAIALSHSGNLLASASRDDTVRLWDLKTRRQLRRIESRYRATSLAFDIRDQVLVIGGLSNFTGNVVLVHLDTFKETSADAPVHRVDSVALSPDRRVLAAGSDGGVVWVWSVNPTTLQPRRDISSTWRAHAGRIYRLAFTPDGEDLVSAGEDGELRLWKNVADRNEQGWYPMLGSVAAVAPLGSQPFAAVAGTKGVGIADVRTGMVVNEIARGHYDSIDASADGKFVAAGKPSGEVSLWSLDSSPAALSNTFRLAGEIRHLSFSPDGSTLAVFGKSSDDGLVLVDLKTSFQRSGFVEHGCNDFAWSPDGRYFAVAENHTDDVVMWDGANGKPLWRWKEHHTTITAVAFDPASRLVASTDDSRRIILWDAHTGREVWSGTETSMLNKRGWPKSLAFSPRGGSLVTLNSAGVIAAWHVATGKEMMQLDNGLAGTAWLTFCGNGEYLCMSKGDCLFVVETGYSPVH